VKFESGSEIKGTIKDDFIVFKLLSGSELGVSPGKIKSIVFLKEVISETPEVDESEKEDTSTPVTSQTSEKPSTTSSTKAPENMVFVERGSFTMGDTWGDGYNDEKPTHKVTFTYDFYMGKYEVTFDEYDAFCTATKRTKPSDNGWGRGQRPVINVSWFDAIAYCNWLSDKENLPKAYDDKGNFLDKDGRVTTDPSKVMGYRLPTEAEWEYAARGGNKSKGYKYSGSNTVGDVAWYNSNSGSKTQEVGKKLPNELGIYDMSGNVWEWCSDFYANYSNTEQTNPYSNSGSFRVNRGGSWCYNATYTRVAYRYFNAPASTNDRLGFRIARTVH
jgi:formylglycine-generating enzyme required for sulfatase activity